MDLDISRAIAAESSNREPLVSEHKSLTTKLRALVIFYRHCFMYQIQIYNLNQFNLIKTCLILEAKYGDKPLCEIMKSA